MDHFIHWVACAVIVFGAVLRMNAMHWRTTPKLEIAAWWGLGVGAFSQFLWADLSPGWPDVFMVCGGALLIVLYTQPQWRAWFADRRRSEQNFMDAMSDRRFQGRR